MGCFVFEERIVKNRIAEPSDNWETPKYFYDELDKEFHFDFDPCPLNEGLITPENDGLLIEWGQSNFINPPYSKKLKESFVLRSIIDFYDRTNVFLLPVSTSTELFHDYILNHAEVRFIRRRIPFIGVNKKGQYVNWHLTDRVAPEGVEHIKNCGTFDSMVVVF
jgi:site-specific DNA-methyltransferase (adenine-specific)